MKHVYKRRMWVMFLLLAWCPWMVGWQGGWHEENIGGGFYWGYDATNDRAGLYHDGTQVAYIDTNGVFAPAGGIVASLFDWDSGNVKFIDISGASGTPAAADHFVYGMATAAWSGTGVMGSVVGSFSSGVRASNYTGTSVMNPASFSRGLETDDGYGIGIGCTAPTTNAIFLADNDDNGVTPSADIGSIQYRDSSAGFLARDDGGGCNWTVSQLIASSTIKGSSIQGSSFKDNAGTGAATFTYGLGTNGYGIDMKSGTASAIATAVIEIPYGPNVLANATAGCLRLGNAGASNYLSGRSASAALNLNIQGTCLQGTTSVYGVLTAKAGMKTDDGYGIGIGCTAPTTNTVDLLDLGGAPPDPGANIARIFADLTTDDKVQALRATATECDLGDFSP